MTVVRIDLSSYISFFSYLYLIITEKKNSSNDDLTIYIAYTKVTKHLDSFPLPSSSHPLSSKIVFAHRAKVDILSKKVEERESEEAIVNVVKSKGLLF
jgi:hypothetical protein